MGGLHEEKFGGSGERELGGVETGGGDGSQTGSVTKTGKNRRPVSVPASPGLQG